MSVKLSKYLLSLVLIVFCGVACAFSQTPTPTPRPTQEDNAKIIARNLAIQKALSDANRAFAKRDYAAAVAIYDAAIAADPTHPGVPSLLVNKTYAQINRGRDTYNTGIANKDQAAKDAGKAFIRSAAEASEKAVSLARVANYPASQMYAVLIARKEAMLIFATRVDQNATLDAMLAFNQYLEAEQNEEKLITGHNELGGLLVMNGSYDAGREEFEKILAYFPKNAPALFGLGEALLKLGVEKNQDKKLLQKSANVFKTFLSAAPKDNAKIKDANDYLATLRSTYNISPK